MTTFLEGHLPPERIRERLPAEFPVTLEFPSGGPAEIGRVVNLSGTGLFVACARPSAAGTVFRLSLILPFAEGVRPLAATVQVRWVNPPDAPLSPTLPPGMGLQFVQLEPASRMLLHAFLGELLARSDRP